jgi:hypothetical protein
MKRLLLFLCLFFLQPCFAQTTAYISAVDSFVIKIDSLKDYYAADSMYRLPYKNSSLTTTAKVVFTFADRKGKNLLKVDETSSIAGDSTRIVYYFHKQKLVKIDARSTATNHSVAQIFYLKNNSFLYPESYQNSPFAVMGLTERSRLYLKFKLRSNKKIDIW